MQVDFAVELGAEDEALEFPWSTAPGQPRYFDLKRHPDLLANVEEAARLPGLAEFLLAVNSPSSALETAKCDAWFSSDINPEEEIFGAAGKFGGYVDFIFADPAKRYSFAEHEQFARRITELLKRVPEIPASAEFLLRRCYYHQDSSDETRKGFYITFYLFGYGDEEKHARQRWAIALQLVENAIRQLSASHSAKS
ncbi:MAG TPA: hypothetical protein VJX16_10970 [Terriglobales bacterium]|nr:hypothetical protein [Terriglobales bacterium]